MNAELACAREPDAFSLSAILIHASQAFTYDCTDTAPEADTPMLEVILRSIDDRLRGIDHRFDKMDMRFDAMDRRFDAMDRRFDAMDQRFDKMDQRFDKMDQRFDKMDQRVDKLEDRVGGLAVEVSALTKSVGALDARMCRVESGLDAVRSEVGALGERVTRVEEGVKGFNDWRPELKLANDRTAELVTQVSVLAYRIQVMPSWTRLGTLAVGTATITGGVVTFLSQGGARLISRWFE
jgi:archaellum component FlaC